MLFFSLFENHTHLLQTEGRFIWKPIFNIIYSIQITQK